MRTVPLMHQAERARGGDPSKNVSLLPAIVIAVALVLSAPAFGYHQGGASSEPIEESPWHAKVIAHAPGTDAEMTFGSVSWRALADAILAGDPTTPSVDLALAISSENAEPETNAFLATAPGAWIAYAGYVVSPQALEALVVAARGPNPAEDSQEIAVGEVDRVFAIVSPAAYPASDELICLLICLSTDATRCPDMGLPP